MERSIIESQHPTPTWLSHLGQPVASRLLAWEQAQADALLADVFGYHAVQLGWPELQALRHNRMPHRWQVGTEFEWPLAPKALCAPDSLNVSPSLSSNPASDAPMGPDVWLDSRAWPWQADSLDLVVLPHSLERSADPHACLREVERVLIPEGQVLITGLNPLSLWGWPPQRDGARRSGGASMQSLIAYRRLRDWLRLLGFEVQVSRFWGWTPALSSERWLQRLGWMERAGERWWPILGGVYLLMATKRVPGGIGNRRGSGARYDRPLRPLPQWPAPTPSWAILRPRKTLLTHVEIHTDGACKGNPGPGGWGVRLQSGQHVQELFGGELNTTNNRMEMTAVIEGLLALKRPCQVTLYLDSEYVRKGITEWIHGWKARGWRTAAKQPVKNADLWQKLDSVVSSSGHQIDWRWVKGHNGDPGNERADALANQGVEKALGR